MPTEGRNVVVGVRFDSHSRELINWALVKVADQGDHVVAVHVCRKSDFIPKYKPLLDGYLDVYEGLCNVRKVHLKGEVLTGSSIRKVLVREAKSRGAVALVVGITRESPLGTWASVAKYCAKHLPPTTDLLVIRNGKVAHRKSWSIQSPGSNEDPRPSFYLTQSPGFMDAQSEFGESEASEFTRHSHDVIPCSSDGSKDDSYSPAQKHKNFSSSSFSFIGEEFSEQKPGWPLLRTASPQARETRKMSVVQWVLSLPNRSPPETPHSNSPTEAENLWPKESIHSIDNMDLSTPKYNERLEKLDKLLETNSFGCQLFSYDVIKSSTSQFSSDKLIGKGGCNHVYKGLLPDGKAVAVKVLKSCKEAWKEFSQEVDIMTSLKHKNITPLLGICVQENDLISVYDFFSRGSLEENLHGNGKEKTLLTWEVRSQLAIGVAEAINYLHNECSQPVIHRDVKSSNVLLSHEFEPQLSDFGLAIWGPSASSFLMDDDVVGTFGYLAPEYFMYGKVSDKIDVYSFGVVLLELLSGRKPISSEADKGQESLVMWAKPKLENGDLGTILDPDVGGNSDDVQIQRMALAARLCLTRSARLRPKMSQILQILKGEKDSNGLVKSRSAEEKNIENLDNTDDEVYPDSSAQVHLDLALLDVEDASTSFSSVDRRSGTSLESYLKGRWSRSSSLD